MPSFTVPVDGVTGTNEWLDTGINACAATNVDNDNDDTDFCKENISGHEVTFTTDISAVPSDISSITSVRIRFKARNTSTRNNFVIVSQTGTSISNGTDTITIAGTGLSNTYTLYSGTAESTYNGTTAWSSNLSQLADLEIKVDKFRNSSIGTETRISYIYAEVIYVATSGYVNEVNGIESGDISSINGIAKANIAKVNGV